MHSQNLSLRAIAFCAAVFLALVLSFADPFTHAQEADHPAADNNNERVEEGSEGDSDTQDGTLTPRLLRDPALGADAQGSLSLAFTYAGDIWIVTEGGDKVASRLTTAQGEESNPCFSPDGKTIAFTGNYDGNTDVYTIPVKGGIANRITHHPGRDVVCGWTPDGERIIFASGMTSGSGRYSQLHTVSKDGGLPEKLPPETADYGVISPDGTQLAFTPWNRESRTWKRYRGGMVSQIWIMNLETLDSVRVSDGNSNDSTPMWIDDTTLCFLSDRGEHKRAAVWEYDVNTKGIVRTTKADPDNDIRNPASFRTMMVYQRGHALEGIMVDEEIEEAHIEHFDVSLIDDGASLRPKVVKLENNIRSVDVSPNGKRAVFEARGEIISVPKEHGPTRNLTQTSGVHERFPSWSPDGKEIAYFSDASGEYDLYVRPADGSGEATRLASLGKDFRYQPQWSPDGSKIAFIEQDMEICVFDRASGKVTKVDSALWKYQGELNRFRVSWSADSRWMTYARGVMNGHDVVKLWDSKAGEVHQLTEGFYPATQPAFDPEGNYLYYLSNQDLSPIYSDLQNTWIYTNTTQVIAVPLRKDVASPIAERNDSEGDDDDEDGDKAEEPKPRERLSGRSRAAVSSGPDPVSIDLDDFESRAVILPIKAGNFGELFAIKGKLIYRRRPRTGSERGEQSIIQSYDLKKRKEKKISEGDMLIVASGGKNMLIRSRGKYMISSVGGGFMQRMREQEEGGGKGALNTAGMEALIDPRAEWQQIFDEAWRFERDFFYDPSLHKVDWEKQHEIYQPLLDECVTRWDVNYVIGEMLSEINAGHVYRWGGDTESAPSRNCGLLGCDFELKDGSYRIKRIIHGAPWDAEAKSPLADPSLDIQPGDALLAVNGIPVDTSKDPWAALQGTASETTALSISRSGKAEDAREVLVKPMGNERRLRYLEWVESNRKWVDEQSGGKVGYIYVPNTGRGGQTELVRQFRAQHHMDALIIDERFNGGGQLPDRFVELLNRPTLNFWGVRDGHDWKSPYVSHDGPKVMLINGRAGSGGDAFPYYFQKTGTGKLIGERTWGGLIGYTGMPGLIDGGTVIAPTFGIYSREGEWIIEGHGVDPDIEVIQNPGELAKGNDLQLAAALKEVTAQLKTNPPVREKKPEYPDRSHGK